MQNPSANYFQQPMVVDQTNSLMMQQPQGQYILQQPNMQLMQSMLGGGDNAQNALVSGLGQLAGGVPSAAAGQPQQQAQAQAQAQTPQAQVQSPAQAGQINGGQQVFAGATGAAGAGAAGANGAAAGAPATPIAVAGQKQLFEGKVKGWNVQKGYGFIQPNEGGNDVFVHHTAVHAPGFRSLLVDSDVEYEREPVPNQTGRFRATRVTGPAGSYVKGVAGNGVEGQKSSSPTAAPRQQQTPVQAQPAAAAQPAQAAQQPAALQLAQQPGALQLAQQPGALQLAQQGAQQPGQLGQQFQPGMLQQQMLQQQAAQQQLQPQLLGQTGQQSQLQLQQQPLMNMGAMGTMGAMGMQGMGGQPLAMGQQGANQMQGLQFLQMSPQIAGQQLFAMPTAGAMPGSTDVGFTPQI